MMLYSQEHESIACGATHLEFIMTRRQSKSPFGICSKERLEILKCTFSRAYPVAEILSFDDLLTAIDLADVTMGTTPHKQ